MMDLDLALEIAEPYLQPDKDYTAPTFEQRVALRAIIRAAKAGRVALSEIRDEAENRLSQIIDNP